ncbi:M20 family metallo-hydrolase [Algoriphagus sp.]|uniref:M20 family metallo-hydrolase n=1 Tax=Algoriphagus sp. TaxID=1872435 RepID=UPI00262B59CF|nr:M20 family metallo-hydrolase [Algoriphagus sp.]
MKKALPYALGIYLSCTTVSLAQDILVNSDRLHQHLMHLSNYGKNDAQGSDRVAFSTHDMAAREYVQGLMREAGLEVKVDFAGNIIGKRAGKNSSLKPLAFGSHIDEVPNGGHYDGPVGSLSAIEVIQTLQEQNIQTEHPLEVIIFANEEGGVVGSRAMVGQLNEEALKVVSNAGLSQAEGITRIGGNPEKIAEMARKKGELAAFLELHIEQGANLYNEKVNIGVVEGIVAIEWWEFTFTGKANHAGTTPMSLRKDPMLPAAKFILAVNETIRAEEGKQVGTVGKIEASPGVGNVIPGQVKLTLEIRDLSSEKIWSLYEDLEKQAKKFAEEYGVEVSITHIEVASKPAMADESIRQMIKESAEALGLTTMSLPSGAGHDAQEMARIAPMGMIFIPSKDGISHAPDEFSSKEDMANGANVLLKTILTLDKKLN